MSQRNNGGGGGEGGGRQVRGRAPVAGDVLQPTVCCAVSSITVRCVLINTGLLFVKLRVRRTGQCGTCCRKWENNQ